MKYDRAERLVLAQFEARLARQLKRPPVCSHCVRGETIPVQIPRRSRRSTAHVPPSPQSALGIKPAHSSGERHVFWCDGTAWRGTSASTNPATGVVRRILRRQTNQRHQSGFCSSPTISRVWAEIRAIRTTETCEEFCWPFGATPERQLQQICSATHRAC